MPQVLVLGPIQDWIEFSIFSYVDDMLCVLTGSTWNLDVKIAQQHTALSPEVLHNLKTEACMIAWLQWGYQYCILSNTIMQYCIKNENFNDYLIIRWFELWLTVYSGWFNSCKASLHNFSQCRRFNRYTTDEFWSLPIYSTSFIQQISTAVELKASKTFLGIIHELFAGRLISQSTEMKNCMEINWFWFEKVDIHQSAIK